MRLYYFKLDVILSLYSEASKEISVDAAKTVKDMDEEKRKRLREVEIKVAKYADKLESSGKETPDSVKEKVEQYRQQLLEVSLKITLGQSLCLSLARCRASHVLISCHN